MIDTSATHNFMNEQKTKRLGLQLLTEVGTIKAVNSGVRSIMGIAKDVPMKIGKWQEYKDIMPAKLHKRLPPRREVGQEIELKRGAKPSDMALYRMGLFDL
ncbi:Endo-1,4-beta-xylanase A [Cucumis melo var. makuwa]|uniref:Endo-1,4-beta-xylanase A n=1 Tax=Cucumis melo var. makuwa TaxID=1194695 RepID=A0A5A7SJ67_CUCMM|nr:Endo-1,4-beta-xylanase A [Cucumis melo var. makuwa]TYK22616.1 Endo-1,4-beta-xylanase A [Cucumis melo var. makuwa]